MVSYSGSRMTSEWRSLCECQGRVMVSINDQAEIRRVFGGFHFARQDSGIE